MERNSVLRKNVNWRELKNKVRENANSARTIPETYESIVLALRLIGDKHSFFLTPEQVKNIYSNNAPTPDVPRQLIDSIS